MTLYAVGDIHGCFETLSRALDQIAFSPSRDEILVTGDLVNRGPRNREVLRWARDNEACVTSVLGNHDLHLTAVHAGLRPLGARDTFQDVLEDEHAGELVDWLLRRPLLRERENHLLVHAGLHPDWSVEDARQLATTIEETLAGDASEDLVRSLYERGKVPANDLGRALRTLITIRTVDEKTREPDPGFAGPLDELPPGLVPWFDLRPAGEPTLVFGHWAALGFHRAPGCLCLDSGCAWNRELTVLDLTGGALVQVARIDP